MRTTGVCLALVALAALSLPWELCCHERLVPAGTGHDCHDEEHHGGEPAGAGEHESIEFDSLPVPSADLLPAATPAPWRPTIDAPVPAPEAFPSVEPAPGRLRSVVLIL